MSDESLRTRTIESLKKEAKRWLHALERNDADARARLERALEHVLLEPTLRDVQLALAREHGVAGWTELSTHIENRQQVRARKREEYDEKVNALLDAYRTGTPEAMERHWELTWHRRPWQGMRTYVALDLGRIPGVDVDITIDDARLLIANEHGFESWDAVVAFVATISGDGIFTAVPQRVLKSPHTKPGRGQHIDGSRDFSVMLEKLSQPDAVGIDANGQMTDQMLARISHLDHLTRLDLGGSKAVTDDGVRNLVQMPNLKHVDLSGTAITDRAIEYLREIRTLESISLSWTRVTDASAMHLSKLDALEKVNAGGSWMGNELLRALMNKPRLSNVFTGALTTDEGVQYLHHFPIFKTWHGGTESLVLTSYEHGPNNLALRGSITDRGVAQLAGLDGLYALNLDDSSESAITEQGIRSLHALSRLAALVCAAHDAMMPALAQLPALRFLGCQDTDATDAGWAQLAQSRTLEKIWGRRCHGLSDNGFRALSKAPSIRGLSVSCQNVSDEALAVLPEFSSLRELMPMDIPDAGYRHIAKCAELDSLVLMYCRDTGDAATEHIVNLPRLTKYFVSYNLITDHTPALLSMMDSLEKITFSACAGITDNGVALLARLPRLREVEASGKQITGEFVHAFPPHVEAVRWP